MIPLKQIWCKFDNTKGITGKSARSVACRLHKPATLRFTVASGTCFCGKNCLLPLIQEKQLISNWRKKGHQILVNCLSEVCPRTVLLSK